MKTPSQMDHGGEAKPPKHTRNRISKVNAIISDEKREELLALITETNSIRRAAMQIGINTNTAKSIYYKFQKTGVVKKLVRTRKDYRREFSFNYGRCANQLLQYVP